jgi:small subunit ribosomal protein S15
MARMYSRKRGKHGSKKPAIKRKPAWLRMKKSEIEKIVVDLAEKRHSYAMIGTILRDQYGVPDVKVATGKSIGKILKDAKVSRELPDDMMNLLKKAVNLRDHLKKNKPDKHSLKGLEHLESKIRRLGKYYIREGRLPKGWKYDAEKAKLIVQK